MWKCESESVNLKVWKWKCESESVNVKVWKCDVTLYVDYLVMAVLMKKQVEMTMKLTYLQAPEASSDVSLFDQMATKSCSETGQSWDYKHTVKIIMTGNIIFNKSSIVIALRNIITTSPWSHIVIVTLSPCHCHIVNCHIVNCTLWGRCCMPGTVLVKRSDVPAGDLKCC